jgi:hypothetical protein
MNEINPIFFAVFMFVTMGASALLHELGHKFMVNWYGKEAKIGYDKKEKSLITNFDEQGLTDIQINRIFVVGVIAGFIPLVVWLFIPHWFYSLFGTLMMILYFWGCKSDIEKIK